MDEERASKVEDKTEAKESPKAQVKSELGLDHLKTFSRFLVKALKSIPDLQENTITKHLGCPPKEREKIQFNIPCYLMTQTCYAFNMYLKKNTKISLITNFSSGSTDYSAAEYDLIRIKRDTRIPLLIGGWTFFKYKDVNLLAWNWFQGMSPHAEIHFNKKDRKLVEELFKDIRKFMKEFNFLKNEKLKVIGGYHFDFLEYPKLDWNNIILTEELKDEILLNIIYPLANKEACKKHDIPWRRGVLLGGEPGTGKTLLAKVLCNLLTDVTVIWVTAESIDEARHVRALFQAARYFAPTLVIMEDLDFFGQDRAIERSPVIGELLNQLDGNSPNEGVFILASSNRPGLLDKALKNRPGRLDVKIAVELPELKERTKMINLFSKGKMFHTYFDCNSLASQTKGFTGAHIKEVFVYAALDTIKKGRNSIHNESILKAIKRLKEKVDVPYKV